MTVFRRFCEFSSFIQHLAQQAPRYASPYMWNEQVGFVTTCPSNLGTGLRISIVVCLPAFSRFMRDHDYEGHSGALDMDPMSSSRTTYTDNGNNSLLDLNGSNHSTLSLSTLASVDSLSGTGSSSHGGVGGHRDRTLLSAVCRVMSLNVRRLPAQPSQTPTVAAAANNNNMFSAESKSSRLTQEQESAKYEVSNRLRSGHLPKNGRRHIFVD